MQTNMSKCVVFSSNEKIPIRENTFFFIHRLLQIPLSLSLSLEKIEFCFDSEMSWTRRSRDRNSGTELRETIKNAEMFHRRVAFRPIEGTTRWNEEVRSETAYGVNLDLEKNVYWILVWPLCPPLPIGWTSRRRREPRERSMLFEVFYLIDIYIYIFLHSPDVYLSAFRPLSHHLATRTLHLIVVFIYTTERTKYPGDIFAFVDE